MNRRLLFAAVLGGFAIFAARHPLALAGTRPSREPGRSVWDSVYTEAQASRGDSLYKATCVKCHGATLTGTDDGSPLTGANFLGNWSGLSAGELYEKIRTTMPPDKPKSIPRPDLADIVAYIFAQNHFPAGSKALSDSAEALNAIKILQSKP